MTAASHCSAADYPSRKLRLRCAVAALAVSTSVFTTAIGAADKPGPPSDPGVAEYRPPPSHPAPRRVGGAARSFTPSLPGIAALVPDHLGMTISEQPVLYWFIDAKTAAAIEFTLIQPGVEEPLVERTLAIAEPGIQRIDLAAFGARLLPGVEYE
jgi:hypothetical protein